MTGDVGVIEVFVVEHGRAKTERRHEPVDWREPILSIAQVGHHLEAACRLTKPDDEDALAAPIDQVERHHAGSLRLGRPERHTRPGRIAPRVCRSNDVQRLHGAIPVEYVPRAQREFVGKRPATLRCATPANSTSSMTPSSTVIRSVPVAASNAAVAWQPVPVVLYTALITALREAVRAYRAAAGRFNRHRTPDRICLAVLSCR